MCAKFLDHAASLIAAQRISELLKREGLSAAELAVQLRDVGHDVTHYAIWRSTSGRTKVRRDLVNAISRLFDYLPADFVSDRPLPQPITAPILQTGMRLRSQRAFSVAFDDAIKHWYRETPTSLPWRRRVPRRSARDCAYYLRARFRLGAAPIRSICDTFARAGIIIVLNDLALPNDRVCVGWNNDRPFILARREPKCSFKNTRELRVHLAIALGTIAIDRKSVV